MPQAAPDSPRNPAARALAHPDAHVPPEPSLARAYYEAISAINGGAGDHGGSACRPRARH